MIYISSSSDDTKVPEAAVGCTALNLRAKSLSNLLVPQKIYNTPACTAFETCLMPNMNFASIKSTRQHKQNNMQIVSTLKIVMKYGMKAFSVPATNF